jgi:hypothetical protein
MRRDRFFHGILAVIAVLLLLNLFKPSDRPLMSVETPAQAQVKTADTDARTLIVPTPKERNASNLRVSAIGGNQVSNLKEIVSLGDGKTFVVSNPGGFLVYQVEPIDRTLRN